MSEAGPESKSQSPRELAKALILKTLGAAKVASWCGVGELAVYQWLQRGTDERPIPPDRVPAIVRGARAEGLEIDAAVLWPEIRDLAA